jgi:long-chain acyl-CoA synthetase
VNVRASVDEFEVPWQSFAEFFLARDDDDAVFLTALDHGRGTREEWTVAQWRDRVLGTADWLERQGVSEGTAFATLAGNSADALSLAYAAWLMGACCVPLNPGDGLDRQAYILQDAAAHLLVHAGSANQLVEALDGTSGIAARSTADLRTFLDGATDPSPRIGAEQGLDGAALRVYTSGTTGHPKGVVLTARNLLTDCDALALGLDWPADTRILTVLPVHHVNGLVISSLLPWYGGLSTVLCDRFRSERFWADVQETGATVCSMVPSLLEFLLNTEGAAPQTFREILCGAGPLLSDTALEFEDRFGIPIRHLYGLSETTAVVTLTPRMPEPQRRAWHRNYGNPSIGPALPHVEVAIHDTEGNPLGAGERGEIVIRGPVVMQEYAGLSDATAQSFRGGWFHSGDEGYWMQEPGHPPFFFITGRLKELIIRGGSNISPLEVDAVLRSHPAVDFGLAIPFENRFYGEEIAAYVVTNSPVTDEEILAHCARYLDFSRQPKVVIQGDDVPFTATGKAKRLELKRRLSPVLAKYRDMQFRRSTSTSGPSRAVASEERHNDPAPGATPHQKENS